MQRDMRGVTIPDYMVWRSEKTCVKAEQREDLVDHNNVLESGKRSPGVTVTQY